MASTRDTSTRILEAARPLFADKGYRGTSIRDITREAGVNLGAVTYHFGSKRALYEAVVTRATQPLADAVEKALEENSGDARERLVHAVRALQGLVRRQPDLPALLFQQSATGGDVPAAVTATVRTLLDRLAVAVRAGKAEGSVDAGDPLLTASSLLTQSLSLPLLRTAAADGTSSGLSARSASGTEEHIADFLRRALAPPPTTNGG